GLNYLLKRGLDLAVGAVVLMLVSPILALAAAAIALTDGLPILYRQTRVGLHGRHFQMLKFRTMRAHSDDEVHREYVRQWISSGANAAQHQGEGKRMFKLTADDRITPIGRWLRRFSIDELPQLINVIRGEMSLIG